MADRRLSSFFTTLIFGAVILVSAQSEAQWSKLNTFPSFISCVYFLDQQGSATTGFVGLENSAIFRTTDNGVTWREASTPQTSAPMEITAFAFRNATQGWCSLEQYSFNPDIGEVWETTDGGQTWNSIYTNAGSVVSIGFCSATNELVAPCWNIKSVCSSDLGNTWTTFAPQQQNGVTFSGNLGFIGIYNTALSTLYSTDGGLTWNDTTSPDAETWSPYAIPGTSTFVAVSEKTTHPFFISMNGGASWTNPYSFTPGPTGCVTGTANNFFVQTTSDGFYTSTDQGNTWASICGPSNYRDTRFYSVATQIFAGDGEPNGNLWYIENAVPGTTLHLDKSTIDFSGTQCLTIDSVFHIRSSSPCSNGILTKAQILSGAPAFSLQGMSLPYTLTGNDSLVVLYSAGSSLKDSGKLLLEFNLGTRTLDTIIELYGVAHNAEVNFSIEPSLVLSTPYACLAKDSEIIIRNIACDSLTLTGVSLSDTTHFQIPPVPLPYVIGPTETDTIPIESSALLPGTFTAKLELHMVGGTGEATNDTVPLTLKVLHGGHAEIGTLNLSVLDECTSIDTEVSILATCDSVELTAASLSDTSFFSLSGITFPTAVAPSKTIAMKIHVVPGQKRTDSTLLKLSYRSGAGVVDTTITLRLQVLYDLPAKISLQDTLYNMGVVSVPCSSASRWITIGNSICRDLTIENITWERADSEFSFDAVPFPITLAHNGGMDSILVHFKPNVADSLSNKLQVTFDLGGVVVDTEITISGVGVSSFHDSLLTPTLSYDTLLACHSDTLVGEIVNLSCDSVIAASAVCASGINYNVVSPSFPVTLAPNSTLFVRIQLQPEQNGDVTDSARVTIYDPVNGTYHVSAISLQGYVIPNTEALTLSSTQFLFGGIAPCSFLDSTIVLTNTGNCEDVVIADTSLTGYPGVTLVLPQALPVVIPPDSSMRIAFHVAPTEDTFVSTQFVLSGQNIDTVIAFSYASLPGGHALAFSTPDSIFTTKPCVPVTQTYWIANVGCYPTAVDTIAVTHAPNGTQFSVDSLPGFPATLAPGDTLYYTVQFDPNGSGNGMASLEVRSMQFNYDRSIGLTGSAPGIIPTARISFETDNLSAQASGLAGDTTTVEAVLLDTIGDTTGLETVSFTLDANWDLLTLTNIVLPAGWSVADSQWNNGLLEIRIRHSAGGGVAAGTVLANCYFAIAVADSSGCDITMSGLRFNDSSAAYDGCVLSSIEMQGDVRFSLIDTCGTPLLRGALNGHVAIEIISVRPNPVSTTGGAAHLELCIALVQAGAVTITLSDMLGRQQWQTTVACSAGTQTLPLALPNIAEGSYFIEASSAGVKNSRKVVFEGGTGKN